MTPNAVRGSVLMVLSLSTIACTVPSLGSEQVATSRGPLAVSTAGALPDAGAPPTCTPGALTLTASPATSGPVEPQTTAVYDVALADGDVGSCGARVMLFEPIQLPSGFAFFANPTFAELTAGQSAHFLVSITGSTDATPETYRFPIVVSEAGTENRVTADLEYVLQPAPRCFVSPSRELFIRDPVVVDDPLRTGSDSSGDPRSGAWTFGRLMEQMAPTEADASALVEKFLGIWLEDQTVGSFAVRARPGMRSLLLDAWPRRSDGTLDLAQAPFRLLAIVNRMDTRGPTTGPAGEGRFVFGALDRAGFAEPFTVIVEYRLSADGEDDVRRWADAWHALGSIPAGEPYNAALQVITDRFVRRGARRRGVNGSGLASIRTNEAALDFPWELRQFRLSETDGFLEETPVDLTPDTGYMTGNPLVANFINDHERSIFRDRYAVPKRYEGMPFQGGSSFNDLVVVWNAPGIHDENARHAFALNACNGCHSKETLTQFLHVFPREVGQAARLSGFLEGIATLDPVTGDRVVYNELQRRKRDLERLACAREGAGRHTEEGARQ